MSLLITLRLSTKKNLWSGTVSPYIYNVMSRRTRQKFSVPSIIFSFNISNWESNTITHSPAKKANNNSKTLWQSSQVDVSKRIECKANSTNVTLTFPQANESFSKDRQLHQKVIEPQTNLVINNFNLKPNSVTPPSTMKKNDDSTKSNINSKAQNKEHSVIQCSNGGDCA